jgi:hypothetical protein
MVVTSLAMPEPAMTRREDGSIAAGQFTPTVLLCKKPRIQRLSS